MFSFDSKQNKTIFFRCLIGRKHIMLWIVKLYNLKMLGIRYIVLANHVYGYELRTNLFIRLGRNPGQSSGVKSGVFGINLRGAKNVTVLIQYIETNWEAITGIELWLRKLRRWAIVFVGLPILSDCGTIVFHALIFIHKTH